VKNFQIAANNRRDRRVMKMCGMLPRQTHQ